MRKALRLRQEEKILKSFVKQWENPVEYRWEIKDIGQGHYHSTLIECLKSAERASINNPNSTIKVEYFKPKRKLIIEYKAGKEVKHEGIQSLKS